MASERPTNEDLRGTEPALHAADDTLSDRHDSDLGGTSSAVRDSRPGVGLALGLLAIFATLLVAAVLLGIVG